MTAEINNPPETSFLQRLLTRLLLALVALAVAVALVQVLRGESLAVAFAKFFWLAMIVGAFGAFAVACANVHDKKPSPYALAGVISCCATVGIFFCGCWFATADDVWLWKTFACSCFVSLALWRCARFSLAKVKNAGLVVLKATQAATVAIAVVLSILIVRGELDAMWLRVMNALWIVVVGGHIAVPLLEKLDADAE